MKPPTLTIQRRCSNGDTTHRTILHQARLRKMIRRLLALESQRKTS